MTAQPLPTPTLIPLGASIRALHKEILQSSLRRGFPLMPRKAMRMLPKVDVAITLRYGQEEWTGTYHGSYTRPIISKTAWQPFVEDNHLKAGDICTFEVLKLCDDCGVLLKVVLLKGPFDTPEERLARRMAGTSSDHAIVID